MDTKKLIEAAESKLDSKKEIEIISLETKERELLSTWLMYRFDKGSINLSDILHPGR